MGSSTPDDAAHALAEAALNVAKRRAKELDRAYEAVVEGRADDLLAVMRVYFGLEEDDAAGDRAAPRLDRSAGH